MPLSLQSRHGRSRRGKGSGEKGIPLAIIITSGFREGGAAGKSLEDGILAIAKKYHVRIMGPNCLGLMLPHARHQYHF